MLNHIHPAVNAVFQALAANTVGSSGDAQASAFADRSGDFFQAEEAGHKGAGGIRNTRGYEEFQQVCAFFQVLADVACSVASLHADACGQETGAVHFFVLNQLLQGHVYIEFIPHAPGCGYTAHQVFLKSL